MTRALLITSLILIMLSGCSTPPPPKMVRCTHPVFGWQTCEERPGEKR